MLGLVTAHDAHVGAEQLAGFLDQLALEEKSNFDFRRIDQFDFHIAQVE